MNIRSLFSAALALTLTASTFATPEARADLGKLSPGSMCAYQYPHLYSGGNYYPKHYSRYGHAFRNYSGADQSVTCPVIRNYTGNANEIEWAGITVSGSVSGCRLETRQAGASSNTVLGWNWQTSTNYGSYTRYNWFDGAPKGNMNQDASIAFKCTLGNSASVAHYKLIEDI